MRDLAPFHAQEPTVIELAADLGYDGGVCEQIGTRPGPNYLFHFFLLFFFPAFPFSLFLDYFFFFFCG